MTYTDDWFIVNETHASHLVCHRKIRSNDSDDLIKWEEVPGPVMIITEHRYRLDASGLVIGLVDARTRLMVRMPNEVMGNGSEYGGTPLVVDDDELYQNFVFINRDARVSFNTDVTDRATSSTESSTKLRELYEAHAQVMRTLTEIIALRDETIMIRDAALRAASVGRAKR